MCETRASSLYAHVLPGHVVFFPEVAEIFSGKHYYRVVLFLRCGVGMVVGGDGGGSVDGAERLDGGGVAEVLIDGHAFVNFF